MTSTFLSASDKSRNCFVTAHLAWPSMSAEQALIEVFGVRWGGGSPIHVGLLVNKNELIAWCETTIVECKRETELLVKKRKKKDE